MIFFSGEKSPDGEFVFSKWNILSKIPCFSKKPIARKLQDWGGFRHIVGYWLQSPEILEVGYRAGYQSSSGTTSLAQPAVEVQNPLRTLARSGPSWNSHPSKFGNRL